MRSSVAESRRSNPPRPHEIRGLNDGQSLTYPKFKLTVEEQRELLSDYIPYCTPVAMPAKPPRTPLCRGALNVPFLQLAIVGNANYLVTGDKDLLSLKGRISCPILTAEEGSRGR